MAIFVTTSLRNYEKIDEKLFELIYFNKKLISAIFYNRNYTKFIGILSKKKNINLPRKKEILLEILNFILLYEFSKKNEHVFFFKIKTDKLLFLHGLCVEMIFFLVRNFKFAIYINLIIMSKLLYNYTSKNHLKIFNCLYLYTWIIAKKYFIIFRKIANDGYLIPKNFLFNYNIKFLLKTKILYIIGNNITSNYFIWEFLIFFQIRKIECLLSLFDFFFFNILKKKKSNLFKILQVIKFVLTISFEIFFFE